MRSSIVLAGLSGQLIGAMKPPLPRPTDPLVGGVNLLGFTPKPTDGPKPPLELIRRAPAAASSDSFIGWLAPDNTCGYVEGSIGGIKTCDNTQVCGALWYDNVGTMACCDTADAACTFFGDCVGYVGYSSSSLCNHACQQDMNTVKCTNSAKPYCYSYMVPSMSVGFFSCDSTTSSDFEPFLTTYKGENDGRTWKKIYDTSSDSIFAGTSTLPTTGTAGFTAPPSASTSGGSTGSTYPSGKKKKNNTGAIAGGVVAGLAAVGAAAAGLIIILLRRKKKTTPGAEAAVTQTPLPTAPGPDMSQQQPPQSMYGASTGYNPNDPRMSMAAGYFGPQPAGKQDYPQQLDGTAAKFGPTETVQAVQASPNPPGSPAPPYAPQPNMVSSPVGSPQPQIAELAGGIAPVPGQMPPQPGMPGAVPMVSPMSTGQPMPGQPPQQFQAFQPPVELATSYAIPTQTTQGAPVFEAPADAGIHHPQPQQQRPPQ